MVLKTCVHCKSEKHHKSHRNNICDDCKVLGNYCSGCEKFFDKELYLQIFGAGNSKCKECKKETKAKSIPKEEVSYDKTCDTCGLVKNSIVHFERNRNTCKPCRSERRKESNSSREIIIIPGKVKACIGCNEMKPETSEFFEIRENKLFRNICRKCNLAKKYYQVHRDRKRMMDEGGYLRYNAELMARWRVNNEEHYRAYMEEFRNSPQGKITRYKSSDKQSSKKGCVNRIEDTLEFETWAKVMFLENCFYCGTDKLIGIDRLDSEDNYTEDNCVPCCSMCNMMKNTMGIASFLQKVRDIVNYNYRYYSLEEPFEELVLTDGDLIGNSWGYGEYRREAPKRGKEFRLSKEEFEIIVKQPCYLCGVSKEKGVGIDRINNNIGYLIDNCRPCCSYCNFMKRMSEYSDFLDKLYLITTYSTTERHFRLCKESDFCKILSYTRKLKLV